MIRREKYFIDKERGGGGGGGGLLSYPFGFLGVSSEVIELSLAESSHDDLEAIGPVGKSISHAYAPCPLPPVPRSCLPNRESWRGATKP